MSRIDRPLFGMLSLLAIAAWSSGCPAPSGTGGPHAGGVKRIIILTNGTSPFWDAGAAGANDAAKDLAVDKAGLSVVVDRNDFSVQGQIDKLKQYANSTDVVAVGISVTDSNNPAIAEEMRRLAERGIKVVTIDSDVAGDDTDARFAYLGTDNVIGGRELGRAARGLRPGGAKYATFVGLKGAANAQERIGGFAEGAGEGFEQLENLGDGGDPAVARTNVLDALNRNADLDMLVGIWSYNAPAIVDIVRQRNIRDKIAILAFDAEPAAIEAMSQRDIDAMIVQNPYQMGYQGVRVLQALVANDQATLNEMFPNHRQPGGDVYDTGLKVVVPDASSPLKKEMFEEKTEFLLLEDFQAWLKKYNLTGS
jgi:ribose transport system substrate-binding protein